ncbi:hypothetical protein TraAM80_08346 [Trypanosoma rangeli]|uniref:Trafficking protein particle complex subunit 11 domain-containing protein n=1 Tax=Trypanosoma rangeli TaxID=5698 RepID=A0A422N156_TRYRA|nr:uncharacterized protein TraAM80_08346 [Trypanosoma rangeli]RNE99183.1 hypothetical protein TraAM80_08346 [Trypanosoma rangeli]|eukprot:RNE99183.1 hypothetical protein TraAM80_08346 [Trypanosoma rangeli]
MEFLAQLYNDDAYGDHLDANPSFSLAVISGKRLRIAEGLSRFFELHKRFRVNYFSELQALFTKGVDDSLPSEVSGILKSNWCSKHVRVICSCVLFCLDWDELGEAPLDEVWLSEISNRLREYTRLFHGKVIIALTTANGIRISKNAAAQLEKLQYDMKMFLGHDFKDVLPLFELGMEKQSAGKLFEIAVELATKYHTEEVLRLKNFKFDPSYSLVRRDFKIGWHYLVLNEKKSAQKHFENSYKILRKLAPPWPAMELRACGTILLFRVLHNVSRESPSFSVDINRELVEEHIMWIGKALRCGSPEFKSMARFLRLLLVGECYEWLFRNCRYLSAATRRDYLVAATGAFEEAIELSRSCTSTKGPNVAPVFVGTECYLDTHNFIFSTESCLRALQVRIKNLLSEIELSSNLSPDALYISVGAYINFHAWERVFFWMKKFGELRIGTYREAEVLHKLWICAMNATGGKLTEEVRENILFSSVSLCFGPTVESVQRHYMQQFLVLMRLHELNQVNLSYPRRGHFAPFTVLCSFQCDHHVCATPTEIYFTLFTASVKMITLSFLYVTVSRLSADGTESLSTYLVLDKGLKFNLNAPAFACLNVTLEEPGIYHCTRVQGCVDCSGIRLNVEWKLEKKLSIEPLLRQTERFGSSTELLYHKPWICVVRPACQVDIEIPSTITAVEGEDLNLDIVIKSEKDLNGKGRLVIHYVPGLYEVACDAFQGKYVKRSESFRKGYRGFVLDDLNPISRDHPLRVSLNYRCLRAGKYIASILFYYNSVNYSDIEIVKKIHLNILYPFSPTYTSLKVLPWLVTPLTGDVLVGSETTLSVPDFSRASIQHEKFVLLHPCYSTRENVSSFQDNRDSLVYAGHTEVEDNTENFNLTKGGEIVLLASMETQALQGLTVEDLDVVCTHAVLVVSLTVGELPCHLEHLEVLRLSMKLRVLDVGKFSLGFIRMILAPINGAQRIVSDLPLPEVKVEDMPLLLTLRAPSIAIIGTPILISFVVANKTEHLQNCEMVIEKNDSCFLIGGRTQWSFCLPPNTTKSTEITMQPLCIGTIPLPSFYLRHSTGVVSGSCAVCVSGSQRICVVPP